MLAAVGGSLTPSQSCFTACGAGVRTRASVKMSIRRFNKSVLRRIRQSSPLQSTVPHDTLTGMWLSYYVALHWQCGIVCLMVFCILSGMQTARQMQSSSSMQPAAQTAVQQISQWWEQQWHIKQGHASQAHQVIQQPYQLQVQSNKQPVQQQHRQQIQQQLPQRMELHKPHLQPATKQHAGRQQQYAHNPLSQRAIPGAEHQAATARRDLPNKRRKGRPNIVSASKAASGATRGSLASLRATRSFNSMLAGSRFRKMDTAAELLAQAQMLQSMQAQSSQQVQSSQQAQSGQQAHSGQQAQSGQPKYVQKQMPNQHAHHQGAESSSSRHSPDPVSANSPAQQPGQLLSSELKAAASSGGQQEWSGDANAAAARQDMQAVALDIVESQLPLWSSKPALDWSARQSLNMYQPQVRHFDGVSGMIAIVLRHGMTSPHGPSQGQSLCYL